MTKIENKPDNTVYFLAEPHWHRLRNLARDAQESTTLRGVFDRVAEIRTILDDDSLWVMVKRKTGCGSD